MVIKGQCHEILYPLFSTVFTNMGGDTVFAQAKNFWVRRRKFKKFGFEYLRKIGATFENTSACQSGVLMG